MPRILFDSSILSIPCSQNDFHHYSTAFTEDRDAYRKGDFRNLFLIENLVIEQIQKLIMDDELIDRLANMLVTELGKENNAIPVLKRELSRVEKGIDNMLNAIQNGVLTPSTKQRLEEQKNELNIKIMQEEIAKPGISREVFTTWLTHFRTYDITDREGSITETLESNENKKTA